MNQHVAAIAIFGDGRTRRGISSDDDPAARRIESIAERLWPGAVSHQKSLHFDFGILVYQAGLDLVRVDAIAGRVAVLQTAYADGDVFLIGGERCWAISARPAGP
jgi:hypothetical protein